MATGLALMHTNKLIGLDSPISRGCGNDPLNGEPIGVARLGFVMEFTPGLQEVSGKFSGKLFGLNEDPLDPNIPLDEFGANFTGRRVNVID